ncbi:helix-turn-helix domain-containing protein [Serratia quinivorans]|uniref:hypothetical protein n=1 Tax=Serratia quinivorans TaxID=137545 RepID=UPI00107E7D68|nr:hypothetical protein [Serratia quinivorans]QBX68498.1 hypothetical protein E4343_21015 [Serratia quinivorans]
MNQTEHKEVHQIKQFLMVDYEILKVNQIINNGKKHKFTDSLKNLYCYLRHWPEAFPSHNKIADVFGISRDAAKDRIGSLVAMGLIERVERVGSSNLYTVNDITPEMTTGRTYAENKGTRHEKSDSATQNLAFQSAPEPTEIPGCIPEEPDYFTGWDDVDPTALEPATEPPTATLNDIRGFAYQHKTEFRGSCLSVQRLIDVYETATGRVFNRQYHAALVNDRQLGNYLSDDGDIFEYATSSDDIAF